MEADQGKIFVGGISWDTSEENLMEYFGQYGDVLQAKIMMDKATNRSRGFGFILFADPSVVDSVLGDQHTIDGRTVDVKRALPKEEQNTSRVANSDGGQNMGSAGNVRTKKIFVGGLPPTLTEDSFLQYFENYGHVTDVVIMYDQNTQRPRGFGFISFESEEAVERVLHKTFHDLNGKQVEVKLALPKDANPGMSNRSMGGGGGYLGYNSSGDGRMDSKGYMQSQNVGGAFGPYGSSGYGTPGYGYGPAANGMGYGGYGGYGGMNPGYPGSAGYGNPSVANAGYGGGPASSGRSSWNAQNPSGYPSAGYGNAAWGAVGAGSVAGQSPNGASGYGNQGYGYGSYGANDGFYGNQGGLGGRGAGGNASSGGDLQNSGSGGYMGGGYGDANGNAGYGGEWRPDQGAGNYGAQSSGSQGAQAGYGGSGGYGGAQTRQAQQQQQ